MVSSHCRGKNPLEVGLLAPIHTGVKKPLQITGESNDKEIHIMVALIIATDYLQTSCVEWQYQAWELHPNNVFIINCPSKHMAECIKC